MFKELNKLHSYIFATRYDNNFDDGNLFGVIRKNILTFRSQATLTLSQGHQKVIDWSLFCPIIPQNFIQI